MPANNYTPRISILSGIVVPGDALSEAVIADLEAIDRLAAGTRRNVDVRVYCADSAYPDTRIRVIEDWREVIRDPHFRTSDIYLHHFGVHSSIHHAMAFARRDARVGVYFHGVTPPQYLPAGAEDLTKRSYQQIEAFRSADVLMAASQYSVEQLSAYGLARPVSVVPLFGRNASLRPTPRRPWQATEPIKLLYCGRFVPSKGVDTLLAAMARMASRKEAAIELLMAGMTDYSDAGYLERLRNMAGVLPAGSSARFAFNLPPEELQQRIAASDALVLPSLHEGFGMPVVEALASGVPVVCSRAGALPEIANGLALSFDAGDAEALAACLDRVVTACQQFHVATDRGERPYVEWAREAEVHSARFSRERYVRDSSQRFGAWLQNLNHESGSFRAYLQDVGAQAFGAGERIDMPNAALAALLLTSELKGASGADVNATLTRLLHWSFPHAQLDANIAYWRGELANRGQRDLLRYLASSSEVRQSAPRRQAAVFMQAQLSEPLEAFEPAAQAGSERLTLDHPTIQLILVGDTPDADFVREAYLLLLGREPEHGGLGGYFESIRDGTMSRSEVLLQIMASTEFNMRFPRL